MATTVGRIDLHLSVDGSGVVAQSAALGRAAGMAFDKAFGRNGLQRGLGRVSSSIDKAHKSTTSWFRSLPHGVRRWTLIIGAIAALSQHIAVLGSGLGSSIALLGTLALGMGAAFGVAIAAFQGMFDANKRVVASAKPAQAAFVALRKELGAVQKVIQGAFFKGMETSILSLAKAVKGPLTIAFKSLAESAGNALTTIITAIGSERGSRSLSALFRGLGPIIEDLGRFIAGFSQGMIDLFVTSLPYAEKLSKKIAEIGENFASWTGSEDGRRALLQWFQNGQDIMRPVISLIREAGRMVSDLVTPGAIQRFGEFFGAVERFLPNLGQFLDVLGHLGIFDVIAEALDALGKALGPLNGHSQRLARSIGVGLVKVIQTLGDVLEPIVAAFAPLLDMFADLVDVLIPPLTAMLSGISDVLRAMGPWLTGIITGFLAFKTFNAIMGGVSALISGIATSMLGLAVNVSKLGPGLQGMSDGLLGGAAKVEGFGGKLTSVLGKAGMIGTAIVGVVALGTAVWDWITGPARAWEEKLDSLSEWADTLRVSMDKLTGELDGQGIKEIINKLRTETELLQAAELAGLSLQDLVNAISGGSTSAEFQRIQKMLKDTQVELDALLDKASDPWSEMTPLEWERIVDLQSIQKGFEVFNTMVGDIANLQKIVTEDSALMVQAFLGAWDGSEADARLIIEKINQALGTALTGGKDTLQLIAKDLKDDGLLNILAAAQEEAALTGGDITKAFGKGISEQTEYLKTLTEALTKAGVYEVFEGIQKDIGVLGELTSESFADGMKRKTKLITDIATSLGQAAINSMKNILQINSPSKVMLGIGNDVGEGFVLGMQSMAASVAGASRLLAQSALSAFDINSMTGGLSSAAGLGGNGTTNNTTNSTSLVVSPGGIVVDGSNNPRETAEEILDEIFRRGTVL